MIPFNKPTISESAKSTLAKCMSNNKFSGDGQFSHLATEELLKQFGGKYSYLTTSCTHALEASFRAIGCRDGDEIIMPSYSFSSTANSVIMAGATPVFVDIDPLTLNMDPEKIETLISENTKAILVLHYAGVAVDFDEIARIAEKFNLPIIEDNAHGLGGSYKGRKLGTLGDISCQSFHETKNIQCGEGGSITLNQEKYKEKIEILREKGTNRSSYFRGEIDKYNWKDVGSSWVQSEILASILYGQLLEAPQENVNRKRSWDFYLENLKDWAVGNRIKLPNIPKYAEHSSHIFYLILNSADEQYKFIEHMKKNEIITPFHYQPLHSSPAGKKYGKRSENLEFTDKIASTIVRLPLWNLIKEEEIAQVISTVKKFKID
jgi:dTDP-4-amino-4,6-dideoxygalactose transaminase